MIRNLLTSSLIALSITQVLTAGEDLLNFENSDTLHGSFEGYSNDGKLIWKNDQAQDPIQFDTENIRRIVLGKGKLTKPFSHGSTVTLINRDVIPCEVLSISENLVSIRTDYAGTIDIPRDQVASLDINPKGHKVLYQGPFIESNWEVKTFTEDENEKDPEPAWEFTNFSLFHQSNHGGAVINKEFTLPDSFQMSFRAEITRYNSVAMIFHADLKEPQVKPGEDADQIRRKRASSTKITDAFGSCLGLWVNSNALSLKAYGVNDDGSVTLQSIASTRGTTSTRISETISGSLVDVRVNRPKNLISAYVSGQLIAQWNLGDQPFPATGNNFGFCSVTSGKSYTSRISDITVGPWTGIRDSAVSLEDDSSDITLLTNGTDRFSGKIKSLKDGTVNLTSTYAEMNIPADEIKSIHFAGDSRAKFESPNQKTTRFRFYGTGNLSAAPISGSAKAVKVSHPILGPIELQFDFLTSIDYSDEQSFLDDWLNR